MRELAKCGVLLEWSSVVCAVESIVGPTVGPESAGRGAINN